MRIPHGFALNVHIFQLGAGVDHRHARRAFSFVLISVHLFKFSVEKIPDFCDFFVCFQLSKVVAINAKRLYNILEHKTESEDCHMTRQDYINAILKLLEKADFRQLRLVWVYASHLIG